MCRCATEQVYIRRGYEKFAHENVTGINTGVCE